MLQIVYEKKCRPGWGGWRISSEVRFFFIKGKFSCRRTFELKMPARSGQTVVKRSQYRNLSQIYHRQDRHFKL